MFMLRNMQRASKRGYAVAASAASLEVNFGDPAPPANHRRADERDRELATTDESMRDGRIISTPRYGGGRRRATMFEGELAPPATMIGHEAAATRSRSLPSSRRASLFHRRCCRIRRRPL